MDGAIKDIPTCQLVSELAKREGVERIITEPYQPYCVAIDARAVLETGPAIILVVTD